MRWLAIVCFALGCAGEKEPVAKTRAELGEQLFNDPRLSEPAGQACADCHEHGFAFSDPEDDRGSQGVIEGRFGIRNAQPAMYAALSPRLHKRPDGRMAGGLFWDGRANTIEEQALPPMLNPLEMNNPDKATVVAKIKKHYGPVFKKLYGKDALDDVDRAFALVGDAMGAFQRTPTFVPFSSKYDRYLEGTAELTDSEARGLAIFEDPARGNCATCHPSRSADGKPLFTTFAYQNIGVPKFANSPFYALDKALNPEGDTFIDRGLAKTTGDAAHEGQFRTPSLRNVDRTGPYAHNGYFRRLDEMIEFHTGSCVREGACNWPAPEVAANVERVQAKLNREDMIDLLAFLRTLTDDLPPAIPR